MRWDRSILLGLSVVLTAVVIPIAANQLGTTGGFQAPWIPVLVGAAMVLAAASWVLDRLLRSAPSMERLDEVEGKFAAQVERQWRWEAAAADLLGAGRLPVRWSGSPGGETGDVARLHQTFQSSPTRRLLILGPPGSGKTGLALLILLELLAKRGEKDPVPVLFGISGWDPSIQPLHDWLVERLLAEYPSLAGMPSGAEIARTLVARRRVLPLLDGLDEVPAGQRALMMDALAKTLNAGDPLILTSRDAEFVSLDAGRKADLLLNGLAIELRPLRLADVMSTLRAGLPEPAPAGWAALLEALAARPADTAGQARPADTAGQARSADTVGHVRSADTVGRALSRPWALAVLRRVYDVHDDPAELLDAARFPDAGAIERHLIDRLIDRQPVLGSDELRFSRDDTRRWLAFLSDHMTGPKTGDLAWWQLPRALSPVLHHGAGGYFGGALMLLVGLTIEVLALPLGWVWLLSIVAAGGLGGALATMAGRRRCLALYPRHYGRGTPASPRTTLRTALASAAAQVVGGGVAAALLIYLVPFAVTGSTPGPQEVLVGAYVAGLMGGLSTPGFTYLLTVVFLAYRRRIPPRLMTFLEHSARIGLLREVGPVYQFRYPHLRDVLVSRHPAGVTAPEASPAAVPGPPPVPVIPPASKIDAVARRKVCEAALVQPDVLRIIDDAREDRSHEAVTALLQRLLAEHADQVERAASAQYERFAQARRRLVEAARLPFWSRPAVPYLWGAWLAGATAAWTAGMWWSPVAFRASLGVALGGCAAVLLVRRRVRGARIEGLFRAVVTPLAPLLVLGIVLSLFSQVPRPPAEPPLVLWLSLALWLVATLLWLSSVPAMRDRAILASRDPAEWLQLPASLVGFRVAAEQAYQDWIGALVREGLMPCFHAVVDDEQDAMTTVLPQFEQNRLGGLSRVEEFVPTEESRYLEHLIARLNSASVGVSGSRGVGKSTVLRHLCARDREDGTANLRLLVHAPTAYDAKEFITHLFAEVCEEVAGEAAAHAHPGRQRSLLGLLPAITTVAGTVLLVGGLRWDQLRPMMAGLTARPALLVAALGGLLAAAGLAATWRANRRRRRVTGATASEVAARDHLRSLRYQQAVTATRTGELGVPGGGKLGGQWAVQRTEQARGYPQLVAELRELLGQIALDRQDRKGKVIIGIDELDKIGNAEDAERLLNDLKVVFGVPGCFFLVALSEDALSAFERRSLAFRNTFDSAFDRIVRITPLRHAESRQLLMRRGIALPLPYVWLCHALTGGLPRDLLRTALDLTTIASQEGEHDLSPLAARMIRQDLAVIIGAHLRDAAQLPGKHAPAVTEWLARCAAISSLSVTALDDLAGGVPPDAADEPVAVQACAYLHILAALIVIFIERPADCLAALQAEAQPGTVDRIAEARLLLATDPRLAWHRIRRIRAAAPFH